MIIILVRQRNKNVEEPDNNHYTGSSGKISIANESIVVSSSNDFTSGYAVAPLESSMSSGVESSPATPATVLSSSTKASMEELSSLVSVSLDGSVSASIG